MKVTRYQSFLAITIPSILASICTAKEPTVLDSGEIFDRSIRIVLTDDKLNFVTRQPVKNQQQGEPGLRRVYCNVLLDLSISSVTRLDVWKLPGGHSDLGLLPEFEISGERVYWSEQVGRQIFPFRRDRLSNIQSPSETSAYAPNISSIPNASFVAPPPEPWPQSLRPVELICYWSQLDKQKPFSYRFSIEKETLTVWVSNGSLLTAWRYNPQKTLLPLKDETPEHVMLGSGGIPDNLAYWDKTAIYKINFQCGFSVISQKDTLILTDDGKLFKLLGNKAELITSVWLTTKDGAKREADTLASESPPRRLVLVEDQSQKKYTLFQWAGKELTPLDVLDKEKQNIAPFLPAKSIDLKIIKAATVMLKQIQKDEQEVAEFTKELEAKKKAQAAEDAKKSKPQTLQERLQKN